MSHPDPNHPFAPQPGPQQPNPQMYPGGWHPPAVHVPPPPRRGRRWLSYGATAFVSLLVGIGIGAGGDAEPDGPAAGPRPTVTVTEPAEPAPTVTETVVAEAEPPPQTEETGPATTIAGDGQYLVGEDIKPGTYKTEGAAGDFSCYWARLRNASGELNAIIANDNITGPARVTVKKGEYFETKRCREWKRVG